jgi:hypothetical protein
MEGEGGGLGKQVYERDITELGSFLNRLLPAVIVLRSGLRIRCSISRIGVGRSVFGKTRGFRYTCPIAPSQQST